MSSARSALAWIFGVLATAGVAFILIGAAWASFTHGPPHYGLIVLGVGFLAWAVLALMILLGAAMIISELNGPRYAASVDTAPDPREVRPSGVSVSSGAPLSKASRGPRRRLTWSDDVAE